MASHSSILAWRIPWTKKPGKLQSMGSQATTEQLTLSLWASQVVQVVKNLPANAGNIRDVGWIPGSRRSPGEENGNPPVFLPGESHGQSSLVGYSPWGGRELNMANIFTFRRKKKKKERKEKII